MILPYLDQDALYLSLRMDLAIDENANVALGKTIIPTYLCPSSNHVYGLQKAPHSMPLADPSMQFAVIDYNGMNGADQLFAAAPSTGQLQDHGSFAERQQLRIANFVDGISQTIDVVETVNFGRGVWIHGRPHYNQAACAINTLDGYNTPNSVCPDGSNLPVTNRGPGKGHRGHVGDFEQPPRRSEHALRRWVRPFPDQLPFGRDAHRLDYPGRRRGDRRVVVLTDYPAVILSTTFWRPLAMKDFRPLCLLLHALLCRRHALLLIVAALVSGGTVHAQLPVPVGTVSNIPLPDANAYSTSLRYDSSGNLYAWDGLSVWEQSGTGAFNNIGSVAAGNSADAGPINFSQDGQSLLLSNGAGGFLGGGCNGVFWTMPASGGMASQVTGSGVPYTGDAVALPVASAIPGSSTKYIVNAGTSAYTSSSLSIFDASTGSNTVVIDNGPGATTSMAINPNNNSLYVGVGYGPNQGNIYSFRLSRIDSAYNSAAPIDFLSGGTLFNPTATGSQNGAGMFFDNNGYLFSGGDGITVFRPDGTISYDQPAGAADGYYDTLTYDPANNEVLKVPYGSSTGTLYNAADFEAAIWTNPKGGTWGLGSNWSGRPLSTVGLLVFAGSTSGTAVVTLDGSQWASALQFGDASAASSYSISAGSAGVLTLGTSTGTSITVASGTHTISAPIVLAGSLAVSTSGGGSLQLGSVSQATGVSAALSLSGDGQLILSGTDSYSGGTTVNGGTLYVTNSSALPDGTSLTVGAGGVFIFDPSAAAAQSLAVSPGAIAAVPEPGTLGLLAAGGVCLLAVRLLRRRRVE